MGSGSAARAREAGVRGDFADFLDLPRMTLLEDGLQFAKSKIFCLVPSGLSGCDGILRLGGFSAYFSYWG